MDGESLTAALPALLPWGSIEPVHGGRRIILQTSTHTVGRGDVDETIGRSVSKRHFTLARVHDGTYRIRDTSSNGTYLNGVRLEAAAHTPLAHGDLITLVHVGNARCAAAFRYSLQVLHAGLPRRSARRLALCCRAASATASARSGRRSYRWRRRQCLKGARSCATRRCCSRSLPRSSRASARLTSGWRRWRLVAARSRGRENRLGGASRHVSTLSRPSVPPRSSPWTGGGLQSTLRSWPCCRATVSCSG